MAEKPKKKLSDGTLVDVDIAAKTAECDADGNTISITYATKTESTTASKKTSSADSTSKLFLIGATSQSADASTTYSNSKCYVGTDNCLYSNNTKVLTSHAYRPIQVDGTEILSTSSNGTLNLKAGTNISLNRVGSTVTINSTASCGSGGSSSGGTTCDLVFQGAGESSGGYSLDGSVVTISRDNYKMLLFEITVNDVNFYLSIPTYNLYTYSTYYYLVAGNINTGAIGIVEVMTNNTDFNVSTKIGEITINSVNVYAYK